jgi:hypothetical protein
MFEESLKLAVPLWKSAPIHEPVGSCSHVSCSDLHNCSHVLFCPPGPALSHQCKEMRDNRTSGSFQLQPCSYRLLLLIRRLACAGLVCTGGHDRCVTGWDPRQGGAGAPLAPILNFDCRGTTGECEEVLVMIPAGSSGSPQLITGALKTPCTCTNPGSLLCGCTTRGTCSGATDAYLGSLPYTKRALH